MPRLLEPATSKVTAVHNSHSSRRMRTFGLTPEQLATRLASSAVMEVDAPTGRVRRRPLSSPAAACAVGAGPASTGLPSQDWRHAA